ncbi:putative repeat protein (TIGR01451 family) [Enteractinococcus coprophilus]|uniref:Putative repeat protein (TIGR01451 family) n=1 Tax=Enteractinococcus coprophilus TaxID=1027633 RepID=A0A543AND8_9MICC|nr:putative repeat protein (TIGR01451 family) [Enteractinococcus coprophilus]
MCNNRKPFRKSVATLFSAALVFTGLTGGTVFASASESESTTVEQTPRQTSMVPVTPGTDDADDAPAEAPQSAAPQQEPRQGSTTASPKKKDPTTSASPSASAAESETPDEETEVEPEETEATITVQVGGNQSGLAGVSLRLYTGGASGPAAAVSGAWAQCTSNASGKCSFTIPDTHPATDDYEQGDNYDQRFWVVQESAPSGWYANAKLGLRSETPYRFRTGPALRAGETYSSGSDFMRTDGSSGTWQNSRANPSASLSCRPGADIALVLDRSGPVGNAAVQAMKKRLAGSNSTVTVIDGGLGQAAKGSYDLAIVVGAGAKANSFADIEHTIRSANAVKAQGTRILAVGIGSTSAANLRAIAGTQTSNSASYTGADVHTIGIGRLPMLLDSVADQVACETTVQITQQRTAYGEEAETAGSGWAFTAQAANATVSPEATQQTGDQGTVSYTVDLDSAKSTSLTLRSVLTDQQQANGWAAKDATCEINGDPVTTGKAAAELTLTPGDRVECTFHAAQTLDSGLKISKQAWGSENIGGLADAPEIPRGSSVPAGTTVTWTYLVTNTGETPLDDVVVTDSQLPDDDIDCPTDMLEVGESMTCTASGAVTADH